MNKKEVAELKRLFTLEKSPIARVCGCYVDAEKQVKLTMREAFLSLPDEEVHKYLDIFKKTLSGTLGKNLQNLDFPLEQEGEGGTQEYLLALKNSKLKEDELLEAFYQKVIDAFVYPENYFIVLVYGVYDIPRRAKDNTELFDASEDVYDFLLCSLCPVKLAKAGLSYHEESNTIAERIRDWFVEPPVGGFLFPAFSDRNTDIHSVLSYSKSPTDQNENLLKELLGCELPLTADSQKDTFNLLVSETLNKACTYEAVKNIHTSLNELLEEHKDDPDPVLLDKGDVKRLLDLNGAAEEELSHFEESFEQVSGSSQTELYVSNVVRKNKFEIKTPDVVITVKPEYADLIETRMIDGRLCFVIPAENEVEVNGIPVRTEVTE